MHVYSHHDGHLGANASVLQGSNKQVQKLSQTIASKSQQASSVVLNNHVHVSNTLL